MEHKQIRVCVEFPTGSGNPIWVREEQLPFLDKIEEYKKSHEAPLTKEEQLEYVTLIRAFDNAGK